MYASACKKINSIDLMSEISPQKRHTNYVFMKRIIKLSNLLKIN